MTPSDVLADSLASLPPAPRRAPRIATGTAPAAKAGPPPIAASIAASIPPVGRRRVPVGRHTLYRGDCLEVMRRLPASSVDVIVTSPPYNLGLRYGSYRDRRAEEDYLAWLVEVAAAVKRVMRPDGSFFLNITGSRSMPWLPFELIVRLRELFHLQNHVTWVKSISIGEDTLGHFKPVNSTRYLHRAHENLFHLTATGDVKLRRLAIGVPFKDKTNIRRRNHAQDMRCRGDCWFIPYETVRTRAEKFDHPCTFPVLLPQMCLRLHGVNAPVVLDPFMGTGTTVLAAHLEGGRGIGIDLDPDYVSMARTRLRAEMRRGRTTPSGVDLADPDQGWR